MKKYFKYSEILLFFKSPFFLFFLSFELFFQKNSNFDFLFLISIENLVFLISIIILYRISKKIRISNKKVVLYFLFSLVFFTFCNSLIENSLFFLQKNIKKHFTYLQVLIFYFCLLLIAINSLKKELLNEILFKYFLISIFYFTFSILFQLRKSEKINNELKVDSVDLVNRSIKKSILLIVLDEYSPSTEINNVTLNKKDNLLEDYLAKKGFLYSAIETSEVSTLRSIDKIFNTRYANSFAEQSIDYVKQSLFNSKFIPELKKNGYNFINFSFIDFDKHLSKYRFDPYKMDKKIQIIKFSIFKIIYDKIFENKFDNFGYNKFIITESKKVLINKKSWNNNFIYLHLLMPHGPFYFGKDFEYKRRNLKNYIEYRRFTSNLIIDYLKSIDIRRFNIFIISDHGFRSSSKINPNLSFFSCSNCLFDNKIIFQLNDFHKFIFK